MELSHYGRFLKRHLGLILGTAVLVAAVAGIVSAMQQDYAQATGSILLKVKDTRQLAVYDYDQFYVVQATDQYASSVVSWLNSAQVRADIHRAAGVDSGQIIGKKDGGTVDLTVTAPETAQAVALVKATDDLVVSRTKELSPGPSRSSFEAAPSVVASATVKPTPVRDAVIGLVAGLVLGLALALIAEAAGPARRKR